MIELEERSKERYSMLRRRQINWDEEERKKITELHWGHGGVMVQRIILEGHCSLLLYIDSIDVIFFLDGKDMRTTFKLSFICSILSPSRQNCSVSRSWRPSCLLLRCLFLFLSFDILNVTFDV